jgi:hypothetical protein
MQPVRVEEEAERNGKILSADYRRFTQISETTESIRVAEGAKLFPCSFCSL